ncbi:50S ribosomal protein L1 [Candidatus Saccharibacteria bacterium]|nr:MAG: 50S ribosomal protein L1 [Candidatus Saccharibacteria bacterium]
MVNRSKDEVRAKIADRETEDVTVEAVKADDPIAAEKIDQGITVVDAPVGSELTDEPSAPAAAAKAGKRSAKAQKEADEKAAKEERKASGDTTSADGEEEASAKRGPKPVTRPLVERRGKGYRKAAELIEKDKSYALADALELATKTSSVKFDASVELHINLGVDPRQADQNIRAMVALPNGTGKTVRVAVFAPADAQQAAKDAGADIVGEEELLAQLDKENINFDILISTPQLMPRLGKHARLLGPRGLMPNPKSGTVTPNVAKAVAEAKAGRVEYRVDKQSIVHLSIGKVSFGADKLAGNAKAFFDSLNSVKPTSLKGSYIKTVAVTTTMGPSVKVDLASL